MPEPEPDTTAKVRLFFSCMVSDQSVWYAEQLRAGPAGGAFARDRADLAAGGVPARVVPPGTVLPDAELLDVHGAATTLGAAARRS